MAQTRLKSGNLHMVGGDNGTSGQVLKSRADGTFEWGAAVTPPTFSSVDYPGDDTALDPAGGQSLVINGGNFVSGITVTIGGASASSVTLNSAIQITVTTPAKTAGTYDIVLTNTDGGTATAANTVSYNGIPAFTNAAGSLGSVEEGSAVSLSVAATEPDGGTITHTIISGSLPSGLSLNATTGAITGTAPSVSADTTSNFTIRATDNENQSTDRAYSITVTNIAPSDNFNAVTYTGNGSSQTITVGFQPDLVWIKSRTDAFDNNLLDSSRGDWILTTNKTVIQEVGNSGVVITSNGFTVDESAAGTTDQEVNKTNSNYIAWCWKANGGTTSTGSGTGGVTNITTQVNDSLGFSIIKFTEGTGTSSTVNHGLSSTPDLVISKRITGNNQGWFAHHKNLSGSQYLFLNTDAAAASSSSVWNGTAPDSTKITLGPWQTETDDYGAQGRIIYAFTSVAGFSKIDSYTGTGSTTNRPIIETGFEPAFVMIKNVSSTGSWMIHDNKRNTANPRENYLRADYNYQDGVYTEYGLDFFSNGFQIGPTTAYHWNTSGNTYIYIAFAADPDTTSPTLADSFNTVTYTGNGGTQSITGLGFKPNAVWIKNRSTTASHLLQDSVRGTGFTKTLFPNNTPAQGSLTSYGWIDSFDNDGFSVNASSNGHHSNRNGDNYVAWAWKADDNEPTINTNGSINSIVSANANAGFSIVSYTGNGSQGATVAHGLGSAPDMIIIKDLSSTEVWLVGNSESGWTKAMHLSLTNADNASNLYWNDTAPTSTVFSIGAFGTSYNVNGNKYIAYCFKSTSGFSKIGSYSGGSIGSSNVITTGFQPDWIMIKRTDTADDWTIIDSVRGDSASSRRLIANTDEVEKAATSIWFPTSTGFYFSGTGASYNASGGAYIYMAFKIN